jgi:Na+/H+ antiporter NhaD/arsenite permease-like protein
MSAVLDNAPTYLVFFGLAGDDAARLAGPLATTLAAISAGACYFGGLTYLGNAPNLMVRGLVEKAGLRMPGFFGYLGWAALCLVPWLLLVEALFFR